MDELIRFLNARLDEREQRVPSEHFIGSESQVHRCPAARDPEDCGDLEYGEANCDCGLTARRTYELADVASKRQIIEQHPAGRDHPEGPWYCTECGPYWLDGRTFGYPCATIRLLALPFASHPDYRGEWRP